MAKLKDVTLESLQGQHGITRTFVLLMSNQGIRTVYPLVNMEDASLRKIQAIATEKSAYVTSEKFYSVVGVLKDNFPEQVAGYKPDAKLRDNETPLADIAEEYGIPTELVERLAVKNATKVYSFMNVATEAMVTWGFSMVEVRGIKDALSKDFEAQSPSRPDERSARGSSPI